MEQNAEKSHHTNPEFIAGRAYQLALITVKIDQWHAEGKLPGSAGLNSLIGELLAMLDDLNKTPQK